MVSVFFFPDKKKKWHNIVMRGKTFYEELELLLELTREDVRVVRVFLNDFLSDDLAQCKSFLCS